VTNWNKTMIKERKLLETVWSRRTAYNSEKWDSETPSTGHCYVTALYIAMKYGGTVRWGKHGRFNHYWNEPEGYPPTDLTSDQYGGDGYRPCAHILSRGAKTPNFNNKKFLLFMREIQKKGGVDD